MSEKGYDDMFDARAFRAAKHRAPQGPPKLWPKSVSELRTCTSFASQGMGALDDGDRYLEHKVSAAGTPAVKQTGAAKPKSAFAAKKKQAPMLSQQPRVSQSWASTSSA